MKNKNILLISLSALLITCNITGKNEGITPEKIAILTKEVFNFCKKTDTLPYAMTGEIIGVANAIQDHRYTKQPIPCLNTVKKSLLVNCLRNYFIGGVVGGCVGMIVNKDKVKSEFQQLLKNLRSKEII